jgi:hypothetical protein
MTKRSVLVAIVAAALAGGVARAQSVPWGADETGFTPPDKQAATCENAVAKALGKALVCVAKCQQARAAGRLADEAAEENCESNPSNRGSCKAKFNATRDQLLSSGKCPACLEQVAMDQAFSLGVAFFHSNINGQIYCAQ